MELIISHSNCDFDGFASMIAASLLYPTAKVCMVGSPETNLRYFLDENSSRFNFIKEKSVNPEEIRKLIIVDNRNPKRMGKIGVYLSEIDKIGSNHRKPTIICYDHHPAAPSDIETDYNHTEITGACTTIMLDFINRAGIQISPFEASVFALGIYEDTGNFLNINTTHKDFAAVSYLFTVGASIHVIKKYLPKDFTSQQFALINQMISQCESIVIKGLEVSFIELELEDFQDNLSWLLQTVKSSQNLKLIFCFFIGNGKLQIIARNDYDFIHLDDILSTLGGGGHKSAAFASINIEQDTLLPLTSETHTVKEEKKKTEKSHSTTKDHITKKIKDKIISQLNRQISEYGIVKDIMTSPADTVTPKTTLGSARKLLINNNYSTILVAKKDEEAGGTKPKEKVTGILTKKDISKALHHNMGNKPVEECMSTNVITVKENESIYNAYKTLVDFNIGRLPVVDNEGYLTGIVTRSDLLIYHFQYISSHKKEMVDFENVRGIMIKNIDENIIELLKQAGHIADILDMKAYVVGGFVRDLLLKQPNYDIDIVIEGDGLIFAQEYYKKFGKGIKTFPRFGTAFVILKNGKKIDISTARTESYPSAGSLPEVAFSRIQNDLYRRDFTINSMAIQINAKHFGKLYDFHEGRRDLRLGIIRVLNNFSFIEDPIRILRAIRFEQRFGFNMEDKTTHLLRNSLKQLSLQNVSAERIKAELIYSCQKGPVDKFFSRLEELGILKQINPNISFNMQKKIICKRLSELIIWFRNSFPKEIIECWKCYHLALFHGLSLRIKEKFAVTLKYSRTFIDILRKTDYYTRHILPTLSKNNDEGEIAIELKKLEIESILFAIALCEDNDVKEKLIHYITTNRFIKPALNGNDLKNLGMPQSKKIGILLDELYKGKINGLFTNKEQEKKFVSNWINENLPS